MKKYLILVLLVAILAGCFSGCGESGVPEGYVLEVKTGEPEILLSYEQQTEHYWSNIETVKEINMSQGGLLRITRQPLTEDGSNNIYYVTFESPYGEACVSFEAWSSSWSNLSFAWESNDDGIVRMFFSDGPYVTSCSFLMISIEMPGENDWYKNNDPESFNGNIPYIEKFKEIRCFENNNYTYDIEKGDDFFQITYSTDLYSQEDINYDWISNTAPNYAYTRIHENYNTGIRYIVSGGCGNEEADAKETQAVIDSVKVGEEAKEGLQFSECQEIILADDEDDFLFSYGVKDSDMLYNSLTFDVTGFDEFGDNITWLSPKDITVNHSTENGYIYLSDEQGEYNFTISKFEDATLDCDQTSTSGLSSYRKFVDDSWFEFFPDGTALAENAIAEWEDRVLIPIVDKDGNSGYIILLERYGDIYAIQYTEKSFDDVRAAEVIQSIKISYR